jgi:hemerythrin-like domain-containing protein
MLRNKNLIPLSHQHQHALALCVRIERASPIPKDDLAEWQSELAQLFENEISSHFSAEEKGIFPAARKFRELKPLVDDLLSDHTDLRARFAAAAAQRMSPDDVSSVAKRLSEHIRKEERQLFERMQQLMTAEELALIGKELDLAWKEFPVTESCRISFSKKK